jgi:hypothetical protein
MLRRSESSRSTTGRPSGERGQETNYLTIDDIFHIYANAVGVDLALVAMLTFLAVNGQTVGAPNRPCSMDHRSPMSASTPMRRSIYWCKTEAFRRRVWRTIVQLKRSGERPAGVYLHPSAPMSHNERRQAGVQVPNRPR